VGGVYLSSLGCRLNQAEMTALARSLSAGGYGLSGSAEEADVIILNTCAVTAEAERKTRQYLRRYRRINPGAFLVVTGCYAQMEPALVERGLADLALGNQGKGQLIEAPGRFLPRTPVAAAATPMEGRVRALVRIQEGCDNRCTYCLVWKLRGPQRSRPADEVIAEVRRLVEQGTVEITLTGVHIGAYGHDASGRTGPSLWELVSRILRETNLARLRLSSIEPWDMQSADLSLWQDERLCQHLHIPLQSGCDAVLARMGRRYDTGQYARILERVRGAVPRIAVTTDVIAGFPGETDEQFEAGLEFVRSCGFARMHVFPYSERPGTPAAVLPDQVPMKERRLRAERLREAARCSEREYASTFIGETLPVLWEKRQGGVWAGVTSNYLKVRCRCDDKLANRVLPAQIEAWEGSALTGSLVVTSAASLASRLHADNSH